MNQQELKKHLYYNPCTGEFRWKVGKTSRKLDKRAGKWNNGYWLIKINNHVYTASQLAILYVFGYLPNEVDHMDLNRSNDSIFNLRPCTRSQNFQNRFVRPETSSGYKGVIWSKQHKKWISRITKDKRTYHIGLFRSAIEAARAYDFRAKKLFGEFARLNFDDRRSAIPKLVSSR